MSLPHDYTHDLAGIQAAVLLIHGQYDRLCREQHHCEQGHGLGQKTLVPGRAHVGIIALEPVGNYAVRITFDDLHDTGIYSWAYLYQLGVEHEKRWRAYLDGLTANGLSREPAR